MKLDLTREQRKALESALDVLQEQIDLRRDEISNLAEKVYGSGSSFAVCHNERLDELSNDTAELIRIMNSLEKLN